MWQFCLLMFLFSSSSFLPFIFPIRCRQLAVEQHTFSSQLLNIFCFVYGTLTATTLLFCVILLFHRRVIKCCCFFYLFSFYFWSQPILHSTHRVVCCVYVWYTEYMFTSPFKIYVQVSWTSFFLTIFRHK